LASIKGKIEALWDRMGYSEGKKGEEAPSTDGLDCLEKHRSYFALLEGLYKSQPLYDLIYKFEVSERCERAFVTEKCETPLCAKSLFMATSTTELTYSTNFGRSLLSFFR